MGSKPKSDKRVKKVKRRRKVNRAGNLNSGSRKGNFATLQNFATYEILQVAEFSQHCKIPAVLRFFFSLFALISFWDLICDDEFNPGCSCLN